MEHNLDYAIRALKECDKDALYAIAGELLDYDEVPDEYTDFLLNIIKSPEFLTSDGSITFILDLFAGKSYEYFNEKQLNKFAKVLIEISDKVSDLAVCSAISEYLGKFFCDERSLAYLAELKKVSSPEHRAMVAEGYRLFIIDCENTQELKNMALTELLDMSKDDDLTVRGGALYAIVYSGSVMADMIGAEKMEQINVELKRISHIKTNKLTEEDIKKYNDLKATIDKLADEFDE